MRLAFLLAGLALPASGFALESSTVGTGQAAQASVDAVNMKLESAVAALTAKLNQIMACNTARKFYAPSDTRKDVNNCVAVQDYDYTATNNSGVYANGSRNNDFMGRFVNNGTGTTNNHGVLGQSSNNGVGVYGLSSTNWSGAFDGGTTGYGVLGQGQHGVYGISTANGGYGVYGTTTINNGWAGVFNSGSSTGGVSIDNTAHNANLCLNGTCTTSLSASSSPNGIIWGGYFINGNYGCYNPNPFTGSCSCPAGYVTSGSMSGTSGGYTFFYYQCYKGTFHN